MTNAEKTSFSPPQFTPTINESSILKDQSWIDEKIEEELEELQDEPNLDDDRFLEEYRSGFSTTHLFIFISLGRESEHMVLTWTSVGSRNSLTFLGCVLLEPSNSNHVSRY